MNEGEWFIPPESQRNCNQDGHFGHNCAALINNNYNGSFFLFYSHKLLLSLTELSVRFDTKVIFYCAATLEAWICHPSVRVCALLCVTVPPAGAHSLFELPLICQWDSRAVRQKWQAGCVKHQPLSVLLMVNKCSSYSLSYVQKGSHSALTTQSPIEKHAR